MKDSLVGPFKNILAEVETVTHVDPVHCSLFFSSLVYFSNEFIQKISDRIGAETSVVEKNGLKAIVVKFRDNQFVAFRGTEFSMWSNTKRVLNFFPKKTRKGRKAHGGFVLAFHDIDDAIFGLLDKGKRTTFTGHSLGGAFAILATEQAGREGTAITFASPNVYFNENMNYKVDHIGYRIKGDIVPHLPPTTFFMKWSRAIMEFMFTSTKKYMNPFKYHGLGNHITTILERLYGTHQIKEGRTPDRF